MKTDPSIGRSLDGRMGTLTYGVVRNVIVYLLYNQEKDDRNVVPVTFIHDTLQL